MAAMPCWKASAVQNRRNCKNQLAALGRCAGLMYSGESCCRNERIANSVSPGSASGPACAGHSQPPFANDEPLPTVRASSTVTCAPPWLRNHAVLSPMMPPPTMTTCRPGIRRPRWG